MRDGTLLLLDVLVVANVPFAVYPNSQWSHLPTLNRRGTQPNLSHPALGLSWVVRTLWCLGAWWCEGGGSVSYFKAKILTCEYRPTYWYPEMESRSSLTLVTRFWKHTPCNSLVQIRHRVFRYVGRWGHFFRDVLKKLSFEMTGTGSFRRDRRPHSTGWCICAWHGEWSLHRRHHNSQSLTLFQTVLVCSFRLEKLRSWFFCC